LPVGGEVVAVFVSLLDVGRCPNGWKSVAPKLVRDRLRRRTVVCACGAPVSELTSPNAGAPAWVKRGGKLLRSRALARFRCGKLILRRCDDRRLLPCRR
jgi:hypothetical protein